MKGWTVKRIKIFAKKCVGCELCGIACSVVHEGQSRESGMRIRVTRQFPGRSDRPFQPAVCQHCEKPKCVQACPRGAIVPNEGEQTVEVREGLCDGCGKCAEACPFSAVWVDPLRKCAVKCDLCRGNPQCVRFCQFGAITSPFAAAEE